METVPQASAWLDHPSRGPSSSGGDQVIVHAWSPSGIGVLFGQKYCLCSTRLWACEGLTGSDGSAGSITMFPFPYMEHPLSVAWPQALDPILHFQLYHY